MVTIAEAHSMRLGCPENNEGIYHASLNKACPYSQEQCLNGNGAIEKTVHAVECPFDATMKQTRHVEGSVKRILQPFYSTIDVISEGIIYL